MRPLFLIIAQNGGVCKRKIRCSYPCGKAICHLASAASGSVSLSTMRAVRAAVSVGAVSIRPTRRYNPPQPGIRVLPDGPQQCGSGVCLHERNSFSLVFFGAVHSYRQPEREKSYRKTKNLLDFHRGDDVRIIAYRPCGRSGLAAAGTPGGLRCAGGVPAWQVHGAAWL